MNVQDAFDYWLEHAEDTEIHELLASLAESNDTQAIEDAFFQELSFGTAGLRGVIGAGTNRMNIYTVGRATRGLADYLNSHAAEGKTPRVVIARDSRIKGQDFVEHAASVLADQGIDVLVFPRIEPTPLLSFAVRDLACDAGINMTASHNPASYNGYKVYDHTGCQITSEAADAISDAINQLDYFTCMPALSFEQAYAAGRIQWVNDETIDRFITAVHKAGMGDPTAVDALLNVAYTPLHGTGRECMERVFNDAGIHALYVEGQQEPNGEFPTCPYPNPETKEALDLGIRFARDHQCQLVLATDPDADRVGVAAFSEGEYHLLTGNEIGILMLEYVCRMHTEQGTLPDGALAVSTIVSTAMIDAIGRRYGVEIRRVLTGFKYIGEIISDLDQQGQADRFLLGFEESYGYLTGTHVRDKDAINAGLLICQMAQSYASRGKSLPEAMSDLYATYGYYANRTINGAFPGATGAQRMKELMEELRATPPSEIAGLPVDEVIDYQQGYNGLPAADVIEFSMGEGIKVIFRPSGTEPKVKAYLFARAETQAASQELLDALEAYARGCME